VDNYTPKKNQMEWHLTYKCNLACRHCNRACFLPPQTKDMTLDDAREVVKQAQELGWHPRVLFMGGEPTLHPQFMEFLGIAKELSPEIQVWSNGYSDATKAILAQVEREGLAYVERATQKPDGSMNHACQDWFVAPYDYGQTRDIPCGCHAGYEAGCGVSVDAAGYTLCCCGGAIDGLLRLGARTRNLADLFDPAFAERQTTLLCNNCGRLWPPATEMLHRLPLIRGARMSPRWAKAAERVIREQK
jgi:hypothetical protein